MLWERTQWSGEEQHADTGDWGDQGPGRHRKSRPTTAVNNDGQPIITTSIAYDSLHFKKFNPGKMKPNGILNKQINMKKKGDNNE